MNSPLQRVRSCTRTARESTSPGVSLYRIQDGCISVRAHGIKFAAKLTDRGLSSLLKKAQVSDRKRPLAPTGVAARVASSGRMVDKTGGWPGSQDYIVENLICRTANQKIAGKIKTTQFKAGSPQVSGICRVPKNRVSCVLFDSLERLVFPITYLKSKQTGSPTPSRHHKINNLLTILTPQRFPPQRWRYRWNLHPHQLTSALRVSRCHGFEHPQDFPERFDEKYSLRPAAVSFSPRSRFAFSALTTADISLFCTGSDCE